MSTEERRLKRGLTAKETYGLPINFNVYGGEEEEEEPNGQGDSWLAREIFLVYGGEEVEEVT